MSTTTSKALGYLFDAISFVLLGIGLYLFLEDPSAPLPGLCSIVTAFVGVFLLRVLMRYPQLFAFPGVWRIDGEAKRLVAPYSVSFIKAITAMLAGIPAFLYVLAHHKLPLSGGIVLLLVTLVWVFGSMALFMLPAVRLATRWRKAQEGEVSAS